MGSEGKPEVVPRVRTRASEAASETAFALLDGLWRAPVGLALFDPSLRLLQVNEHLAELNGVSPEAEVGRSVHELFPGAPSLAAHIEQSLRDVFASGRPVVNIAMTGLPADPAREWLASWYPVVTPSGDIRAVCVVVVDATEDHERTAALERARDEAERRALRLALLQDMTAALSAAYDPQAVARVFVERIRGLLRTSSAVIRDLLPDRSLRVLAKSAPPDVRPEDVAAITLDSDVPLSFALRREEAVWLETPDVVASRFPQLASVVPTAARGAIVAVPLTARGRVLGGFALTFDTARAFDLEERAFLLSVGEQCAQALDRAMLHASERDALGRARATGKRLSRLQAITSALAGARTAGEVGAVLVAEAERTLGVVSTAVYTRDARGALQLVAQSGLSPEAVARIERLAPDAPYPVADVVRTGEPRWFEREADLLAAYPALRDVLAPDQFPSAAAILPLIAASGPVGALRFAFAEQRRLERDERALLRTVAAQAAQAMERATLFDRERRAREEAERARGLLDAIVDNAPIGIGFFDRELRFVRLNGVLAGITGLPIAAHLGRTLGEVVPLLPVDLIEAEWRRVLETGTASIDHEIAGETPAAVGQERNFLASYYPVRAGDQVIGLGVLIREVTAERAAEEFQRNVLGIVSHDLRNPLGAIVTGARLLTRGEDVTPRQAKLAGRVLGAAERMERIVQMLLDYAQASAGRGIPVRPRPCDLGVICDAVADECEAAHVGREVVRSAEGDPAGEWDPDRLAQALTNLVTNALDYSPEGTAVRVTWRGLPEVVEIAVENQGAPIAPELLGRLFEPFRRGPGRDRGRHGLGLGLFIVRAIATAHGGRIEVRSGEGGTAFTLTLPRRRRPPPP